MAGCSGGLGKGLYSNGAGSGAGHGGRGGSGIFNGRVCNGGHTYGDPDFPCELGSGAESPDKSYGNVTGGGMIGQYYCISLFCLFIIYYSKTGGQYSLK